MKTILAVVVLSMVAFSMVAGLAMASGDAVPVECTDGSCGSDLDCETLCGGGVEL